MNNAKYLLDRIEALATHMTEGGLSAVDSAIAYATIKVLVSDLDAINEEEHDENEFIDERLGDVEDHAAYLAKLADLNGHGIQQHYLWLMTATSTLRGKECFDVEEEDEE